MTSVPMPNHDPSGSVGTLEERAWRALENVFDPCSISSGSPLSVSDLGLVRSLTASAGGVVRVVLLPTTPSCSLLGSIAAGVDRELRALTGVVDVQVSFDYQTLWGPEMMSAEGRARHRAQRNRRLQLHPVRPRQWKESATSSSRLPAPRSLEELPGESM